MNVVSIITRENNIQVKEQLKSEMERMNEVFLLLTKGAFSRHCSSKKKYEMVNVGIHKIDDVYVSNEQS